MILELTSMEGPQEYQINGETETSPRLLPLGKGRREKFRNRIAEVEGKKEGGEGSFPPARFRLQNQIASFLYSWVSTFSRLDTLPASAG